MRNIGQIFWVLLYTTIFSLLLFVWKNIVFPSHPVEEWFIEPSLGDDFMDFDEETSFYVFQSGATVPTEKQLPDDTYKTLGETYQQKQQQAIEFQKEHIQFYFVPTAFQQEIQNSYLPLAQVFLYDPIIVKNIEQLGMFFYKNEGDVRGRMKKKNIHLFGVESLPDDEFLAVLIHEFGHYFDIYSFRRNRFGDESQKFYDISWEEPTVIGPGGTAKDFVSGYAMTNQYEDFAESYVYYVLHNRDFLQKSESSDALAKKYDFFKTYIFTKNQFYKENFSPEAPVQDYYWDITKIEINVKNFLQYLENSL